MPDFVNHLSQLKGRELTWFTLPLSMTCVCQSAVKMLCLSEAAAHRIVRRPVVDTLKLDAGSTAHGWQRDDVAVGGGAHSADVQILKCVT